MIHLLKVLNYNRKHIVGLFIIICIISVLLYSTKASFAIPANNSFLNIQEVTSETGITAWLVEDHNLPIIAMKFTFVGFGSSLESKEKQGLVQLLSNTLDEGAGELKSQEFQKELTDHSISLSFSSSRDNFYGNIVTLTQHKNKAFELMRMALSTPRFDNEAVERMRDANLARVRSSMGNANWIAARIMNDVAYDGHAYAMNSGGTLSSLKNISSNDLKEFKNKYLTQDRLLVAVSGDISAEELKNTLNTLFDNLPETRTDTIIPDHTIQNQGEVFLHNKDIPQTIINILQPGIDREHPDFYAAYIMNFILGGSGFGSRLTEEIRKKRGLTYGIHTWLNMMDHIDTLSLSTSTRNEAVPEVLELIKTELTRMRNTQVTDKELANAKSYLIGSMPLSITSTGKISSLLLNMRLDKLPIDYLDQRAAMLNKVTKEDIQRIARSILTPENMTVVLVGNPENITATKIIKNLPNVD